MTQSALKSWAAKLLNLLLALPCAGLVAATGATFAARAHWALELSTHFVLQYALAALVLALVSLALRRRWIAAVLFAVLAVHGARLAGAWQPVDAPNSAGSATVRVLIANVNGANRQFHKLRELIEAEQPDVVLLMEVRTSWSDAMEPLHDRFAERVIKTRSDNFGIAAYSSLPLRTGEITYPGDEDLPSIELTVERDGQPIHVLLTHPIPPTSRANARSRDRQLLDTAERAKALGGHVLLTGDFNATPWSPIFHDVIERSGLGDSRRGFGLQTTWISRLPSLLRIPIDHALVSPDLEVTARRVGPHIGSDHRPLILDIR